MPIDLNEIFLQWYAWLSSLNNALGGPIMELGRGLGVPLLNAFLFGLLGVIHWRMQAGQGLAAWLERRAATALGTGSRIPVSLRLTPQRTLMPSTALAGTEARPTVPPMSAAPVRRAAAPSGCSGFLLGLAFSGAFCPTLFLLFFGVTMTLAARTPEGAALPAVFALGTAVPLVLFVGLALVSSDAAQRFLRGVRRANRPLRWMGGALLILLGLHDTLTYWFL